MMPVSGGNCNQCHLCKASTATTGRSRESLPPRRWRHMLIAEPRHANSALGHHVDCRHRKSTVRQFFRGIGGTLTRRASRLLYRIVKFSSAVITFLNANSFWPARIMTVPSVTAIVPRLGSASSEVCERILNESAETTRRRRLRSCSRFSHRRQWRGAEDIAAAEFTCPLDAPRFGSRQ